jgi:hypothetical protein
MSWYNPASWFNNVSFQKKGKDYVYLLTNNGLGEFISCFNGGYSEANMMTMFEAVPEFAAVIDAVASRVKNGTYKLVDKKTGEEIEENKLWNKISTQPNWQFTFKDMLYHAIVYKYCTGNLYGFSYIPETLTIKHANIMAVWLLPAHYVWIKMKAPRPSYLTTLEAKEFIDLYQYNGGDSMSQIKPDYITHQVYLKVGNATDIVQGKGISPFKAAEYPLSNLIAVYKSRNAIYVKHGPLGFLVSKKSDVSGQIALTPDEKKQVRDDLMNDYGVTGGDKSLVGITAQPMEFIKTGANIQELEPFKETLADTAALAGVVGVPMALIPKTEESKFANLDIAERNFYDNKIIPEAEAMCDFLTKLGHFDEIGAKVVVTFDNIKALQDDEVKKAQAFNVTTQATTQLYDDGHITKNQLLEKLGYEGITGGDDYIDEEERKALKLGPKQPKDPNNIDDGQDPEEGEEDNAKQ